MTTAETAEELKRLIGELKDPELDATLAELDMVKSVSIDTHVVTTTLALTTLGCPMRAQISRSIEALLPTVGLADHHLQVEIVEMDAAAKAKAMSTARGNRQARSTSHDRIGETTQVLAFASGKGGVGKSSITTAVARSLAHRGFDVGVLDADIWGYSQPRLLREEQGSQLQAHGSTTDWQITPAIQIIGSGSLRIVSMGLLGTSESEAIMWRGMLLARAFQHFIDDVAWDEPDYLLIDLPPGTGDIPLTLAKLLPRAKIVLVTTPSPLAVSVAQRAASLAVKSNLDLIGVIENMSWITCPDGQRIYPFGSGGGFELAERIAVPLLGQLPLSSEFAKDAPDDSEAGPAIDRLVSTLIESLDRSSWELDSCSARLWDAVEQT
ncbi:MAG: P-loop NTPase [Ferrimicrobium sp.]